MGQGGCNVFRNALTFVVEGQWRKERTKSTCKRQVEVDGGLCRGDLLC